MLGLLEPERHKCRSSKSQYEYTALEDPANQIRLLDIEPGKGNETIFCSLRPVDFQAKTKVHVPPQPSYEAVSYTWGMPPSQSSYNAVTFTGKKPPRLKNIRIAGKKFAITENLYTGLQALRFPDRTRSLWVDAVCIDQSSMTERNQQIQKMAAIYAGAHKVLVWLAWPKLPDLQVFQQGLAQLLPSVCPDITTHRKHTEEDYCNFHRFQANPWFGRKWIVQEFVLARRIQFYKGSSTWDFDPNDSHLNASVRGQILVELNAILARQYEDDFRGDLFNLLKMRYSWYDAGLGARRKLSQTLFDTAGLESTSFHDRIYACLGMCDWSANGVEQGLIDYNQDSRNVVFTTTRIIAEQDRLDFLANAIGDGVSWSSLGLEYPGNVPSFVPKYLFHTSRVSGMPRLDRNSTTLPRVRSMPSTRSRPRFTSQSQLLLRGRILGHITDLVPTSPLPHTHVLKSAAETFSAWHKYVETTAQKYSKPEELYRQFFDLLAFECYRYAPTYKGLPKPTNLEEYKAQIDKMPNDLHLWASVFGKKESRCPPYPSELFASYYWLLAWISGMILGQTDDGLLGLVHNQAHRGDIVFTCDDCSFPLILRPRMRRRNEYAVVGNSIFTDLTGADCPREKDIEEQEIVLI